jgi:hypothetical protein
MMSGKALLVAVLLVGVASRCSASRGLQGDHVPEQKRTCCASIVTCLLPY